VIILYECYHRGVEGTSSDKVGVSYYEKIMEMVASWRE